MHYPNDLADILSNADGEQPATETIKLELPTEAASTLEKAARYEGMSVSELVEHMIADYAQRNTFLR